MSRPDPLDQQVIAEFRARGVIKATGNLSLLLLHHVGARSGTETCDAARILARQQ